jgi:UPF0716 protein FxsA
MAALIALAFILIPVAEIALFIKIGGSIGLWNTLGLIILTAIIGTALLRAQGLSTLRRAQESFQRQIFPMTELFDGVCLLIAGVMLLTPGFATDAFGLALFIPWVRAAIRGALLRYFADQKGAGVWIDGEEITGSGSPGGDGPQGRGSGGDSGRGTIEGEFHEIDSEAGDKGESGRNGDRNPWQNTGRNTGRNTGPDPEKNGDGG